VLRPTFQRWAQHFGVSPALLEAMCWWESGWQSQVVSSTGAIGVGQLEPATVSFVEDQLLPGAAFNAYSASDNIEMSAAYLAYLLRSAGGDAPSALAGYYQGMGSVHRVGMLPATRQYVTGILAYVPSFS
jgi:soluble lytic murein transglycosylase-like protein